MGIYVKKRNVAGLKILLICVLVITIVITKINNNDLRPAKFLFFT